MGQSTDAFLFFGWDYENGEEPEGLSDKWKEAEKSGIKISSHCSGDYPMYYVAAKQFIAHRGYPQRNILAEALNADVDVAKMKESLQKFCEQIGIEYKEPSWILASDWN